MNSIIGLIVYCTLANPFTLRAKGQVVDWHYEKSARVLHIYFPSYRKRYFVNENDCSYEEKKDD